MSLSVEWMKNAACAGHENPEAFFPKSIGRQAFVEAAEALAVCARCPVVEACAAYQKETGSVGVWGSTLVASKDARTPEALRVNKARCGTLSGYRKHELKGEPPCHQCYVANAVWQSPQGNTRIKRWG